MILELDAFAEGLRARNFAPVTVQGYGYTLRDFVGFLLTKGVEDVRGITRGRIQEYLVQRLTRRNAQGQPCGVGNRNNALKAVKAFCAFLAAEGHLGEDPSLGIPFAKEPQRLPRNILTPSEVRKVLALPDQATALGSRDRSILELLYSSGLRNAELRSLKVTDLNLEEGVVQVVEGKGRKDRYVPVGKVAARHLSHYMQHARLLILGKGSSDVLFLGQGGRPLSKAALGLIVKGYAKEAGITKRITPHSFRHTCATHLLQNRASLRHIQEILGHSSVLSTQVYTSVTIAELKETHRTCHPRAQDLHL